MSCQMRGEFVERLLDLRFIGEFRTRTEARQPGGALAVVAEKPMDISAHHAAIVRYRAIGPSVGESQKRRRATRPVRPADMHLVAVEGRTIGKANAVHGAEDFFA